MLKNMYYSIIITCLFWGRHFLTVGQPHNAFYYSQTLEDFIFVCIYFFLTGLVIFFFFSAVRKYFTNQYMKVAFATLYISILPLLDFVFLSIITHIPILPGFIRLIYPTCAFIYITLVIFITVKYRIEKYGEKIAVMLTCICVLIIYYAIPRSFNKNIIENTFIFKEKTPVHLIIFDAMSYEVLNHPQLKHLFPNINNVLAINCFVFEDAHSPGSPTIESIPKLLTGIKYDRYREYYSQFLIVQPENQELKNLPINSSLFHVMQLSDYNTVLIGNSLPYCNLFGDQLTYGKSYPNFSRMSEALPLPFSTLFFIKYRHYRNDFIKSFNNYISKIDSSPKNTFYFIHFMSPHEPFVFNSRGPINRYWEYILKGGAYNYKENYIEQLRYDDKKVGEIIKKLKEAKLYDRSLIIITSDTHHPVGRYYQQTPLGKSYDVTKVPLFIKAPFQNDKYVIMNRVNTINMNKLFLKFLQSNVVDIKQLFSVSKLELRLGVTH